MVKKCCGSSKSCDTENKRVCCKIKMLSIVILCSLIAGMCGGFIASSSELKTFMKDTDQLRKHFYSAETATHVSPHHIRKHIAQGDDSFVLVDLRSQQEYERQHIVGAVNVPAYASPEKSAYGDVERIVASFEELASMNKEMIVYCYSGPCMTGRKIGKILADHGIYVKHLGIGWNEWRYHWTVWNHEHEWEVTNVMDFVISGPSAGEYKGDVVKLKGCSAAPDELGC